MASRIPRQLDDIGMGMAGILDVGRRGYELDGPELIDFVRRSLYTLLDRGGVPWQWPRPGTVERNVRLHYGADTREEMVEGMIADWLARGDDAVQWGDLWMARPGAFDR